MAKRKKKLPDIEENLDKLKEQEGEPVVGKLEEVEVKVGEVGELAEPLRKVTDEELERVGFVNRPVKVAKPKMPPTSEIFSIKDQADSKLVIKKDGTKLTIPK